MANQPNPASGGLRRLSSDRMLAIGWLLMGLLAGLLIGWVIWPVQWSDAEPDNLRPDAHAHFISATADAYVASGGQDPNTALARMQSFADPQAAVQEAILFFQQSGDPNWAIREVNLRSLASALDARSFSTATTIAPSSTPANQLLPGWLDTVLVLLAALLLLGGLGWQLFLRRTRQATTQPPTPSHTIPLPVDPASLASPRPQTPTPSPKPSAPLPDWQPSAPAEAPPSSLSVQRQPGSAPIMETWDNPADALPPDDLVFPAASQPAPHPAAQPAETIKRIMPGIGHRADPPPPDASINSSRGGKEIASYTAEYNIGIMAYEQSFAITSTEGEDGTPLGACGMGISETLDKSAANSNNVRVLDVWLYDGVDVRSASQYLVSPGLDKEALGEQAKSAGTITGEPLDIAPGETFRIASKNLLLDCRIVTADFLTPDTKPSPLRTVRVEMSVKVAK